MKKQFIAFALAFMGSMTMMAQQSHVNIQYDPQRNTENITPFSAQVISPEVHDDHFIKQSKLHQDEISILHKEFFSTTK